ERLTLGRQTAPGLARSSYGPPFDLRGEVIRGRRPLADVRLLLGFRVRGRLVEVVCEVRGDRGEVAPLAQLLENPDPVAQALESCVRRAGEPLDHAVEHRPRGLLDPHPLLLHQASALTGQPPCVVEASRASVEVAEVIEAIGSYPRVVGRGGDDALADVDRLADRRRPEVDPGDHPAPGDR